MTAQDSQSPVQLVQSQLEALNRHDLIAFTSVVAEDISVTDEGGSVLLAGKAMFTDWYAEHFAEHPSLKADLLDRMALGDWVIDEVMVTGYSDNRQHHLISIIRIQSGRIESIRLIRG